MRALLMSACLENWRTADGGTIVVAVLKVNGEAIADSTQTNTYISDDDDAEEWAIGVLSSHAVLPKIL